MTAIYLSIAIILVFFLMGDWLHRLLAAGPSRTWAARIVLSSWMGLLLCLVVMTTLYHGTRAVRIRDLAWPLAVLLTAASVLSAFLRRKEESRHTWFPWELFLVGTAGFALISTPFFGLTGSGFYSTATNGEYITYAAIADAVKHHRVSAAFGIIPVESRESVSAFLCAFFSTLFGLSSLFIVQPFSNAVAWLSFAAFGILLHRVVDYRPATLWPRVAMFMVYSTAVLSAANQQLWTMSFLSQYVNTAILFALFAFLAEYSDGAGQHWVRQAFAIGIAVGAMLCAYPEMFLGSLFLVGVFYLLSAPEFTRDATTRVAGLGLALSVAAVVGNKFGFDSLRASGAGAVALTVRAGWDIFGRPEFHALIGNLSGLSNLFYAPQPSGPLLTGSVIVIIAGTFAHAATTLNRRERPLVRGVSGLAFCYLATSVLLFAIVATQHRETNYVAVKFVAMFVWFFYMAAALCLARIRVNSLRAIAFVLWAAVLFRIVSVGTVFATGLRDEARTERYSEQDMKVVRSVLGDVPDVHVLAEPWNLKVVGVFLTHGENLLRRWTRYPSATITTFANQEHILALGMERAGVKSVILKLNYHVEMRRDALAVWARDPRSTNGIRTITASSFYGGQSLYGPDKAIDGDENTQWASDGPGSATLVMTSNQVGIVESIKLLSRNTGMFECWRKIDVGLYLGGRQVSTQTFSFPDAATTRLQEIALQPFESDRIELLFSDAVTRTPTGEFVDSGKVNPGYAEILLTWKR